MTITDSTASPLAAAPGSNGPEPAESDISAESAPGHWTVDWSSRPIYAIAALAVIAPTVLWVVLGIAGGLIYAGEVTSVITGPLAIFLPMALLLVLFGKVYGWVVPLESLARGETRSDHLIEQARRTVLRMPGRVFIIIVVIGAIVPAIGLWSIHMHNLNQPGALSFDRVVVGVLFSVPAVVVSYPLVLALMIPELDPPLAEIGAGDGARSVHVWSLITVLPAALSLASVMVFALSVVPELLALGAGESRMVSTDVLLARIPAAIIPGAATAMVYLVIAFFMHTLVARTLLQPLDSIAEAASAVAHGNLRYRPMVLASRSELGRLGDSFNEMQHSLRHLVAFANRVSDGDLRLRLTGDSELSRAINRLVATQAELVRQLTETTIQLNSGAAEIFATSSQSESNSTEQASSVEETKRTMKNLLESSSRIAESAHIVYQNAEQTMDNIRLIAERLSDLVAHNQKIGEILDFVKEIADRSDLLALNASLEGTRAGEAGRGFSLVAAEMRRLAESVMDSVKDIKQLVADVRASSQASVLATEEGMKLGTETTESAKRITFITQQQQTGTEQVSRSMDEISELLNQSVAGSKQVTMSADELKGLSERLQNIIEAFRIDGIRRVGSQDLEEWYGPVGANDNGNGAPRRVHVVGARRYDDPSDDPSDLDDDHLDPAESGDGVRD